MAKEYIEREAAYDTLTEYYHHSTDTQHRALLEALSRVPAAEVAPVRHGKWNPFDLTWGHSIYACTVCEEAIDAPTRMGKPIYAYCPACGADMREVQDG